MDVLVHNKDEFVLLFLECGVKLKNFVKVHLYDLYDQVCTRAKAYASCVTVLYHFFFLLSPFFQWCSIVE